jgi:hypothetical protein
MADIASSDLTYSFKDLDKQFLGRHGFRAFGSITGGDGALTWPTAGLALSKTAMGFKTYIRSVKVIETNLKGYKFEWDVSAQKLVLCGNTVALAAGANATLATAVWSNSNILSHNATAVTVNAGVGNAARTEALAAFVLQVEVIGY